MKNTPRALIQTNYFNFMKNDYYWLNDDSKTFLYRGYVVPGKDIVARIHEIADCAAAYLPFVKDFKEKFVKYMARGYYSLSSPIWANLGAGRGLSISCNGSFIEDTMDSIMDKVAELGVMTKNGAGTSAYFGALRPRGAPISDGGKSSGPVHFLQLYDTLTNVVSQSNVRRGSMAAYLPVDHPDILEFLQIRAEGNPIQKMSIGVCISNDWMQKMIDGDKDKRAIWAKIIEKRFATGYPYLFFSDNVNDHAPDCYKDKEATIWASNLCSEIMLPAKGDESFVCNLSSMNLLQYDEWKDTDAVEILTYFLDAVMSDYIEKTEKMKHMEAAHNFAKNHRALGIGVLGWHSLLQSKMIAFESLEAKWLNKEVFSFIQKRSKDASKYLATELGEPEMLKGYGYRNTTTMAIAPTTSSSFILGQVSPGIEPLNSNYFINDLAKGSFTYKNPFLEELLEKKGLNKHDVWMNILKAGGSVQHMDELTQEEKDVFKTFGEISQREVVLQAAMRQKYIDQGQSLNVTIPAGTKAKEVSDLLIYGWQQGLKTFYYQRGANPAQHLARSLMTCTSCQG